MNLKLENYKNYIKDKKVAVLGVGISNTPLIRYLASIGTDITAFDKSEEDDFKDTLKALEGINIKYHLGKNYLDGLKGFDVIFKTPKIRFDIPELLAEKERGALITSEMEVFCELCPARIFAITGSDGKTTTTTLIYNMLLEQGYKCWLGGNIGTPLLDRLDEIVDTDMVVLELSSFQLHTMKCRLNTAVITNISPNHLDVHKSMYEYIDAKKNIFRYQNKEDLLVLNYDNDITRTFAADAKGKAVYFSRAQKLDNGITVADGVITNTTFPQCFGRLPASQDTDVGLISNLRKSVPAPQNTLGTRGWESCVTNKEVNPGKNILNVSDIKIPGDHNVENYLAAIAAVIDFVKPEVIRKVAASFGGVEHRNEFVRELNGVKFYNDSIGSTPTRTIATIKSFKQKLILITGGYDKHIPYDEMGEVLTERVKCLILIGQTAPLIEEALKRELRENPSKSQIPLFKCFSLEDAVKKAYENSKENDIILLSPASASFDMFKNFEERGNRFKEAVHKLL